MCSCVSRVNGALLLTPAARSIYSSELFVPGSSVWSSTDRQLCVYRTLKTGPSHLARRIQVVVAMFIEFNNKRI